MPFYETVFMSRQDISAAQVEKLTEDFSNIITEHGGKIASVEQWGLKTLAYRVKKNRKAHYTLMNIDAPHPAIAEMERQMGLNEDVLRVQTLRLDALPTEPSVMMGGGKAAKVRKGKPAAATTTAKPKAKAESNSKQDEKQGEPA